MKTELGVRNRAASASADRLTQTVRWLSLIWVFLQPVPHVGALRQIALAGLVVAVLADLVRAWRQRELALLAQGYAPWFWLLGLWALIASFAGPYPADSLDAMRKGWMPQALLLAAMLMEFRTREWQLRLLRALVYGFVAATLLAGGETLLTQGALINGGLISHDTLIKGYAAHAALCVPMLLFLAFRDDTSRIERTVLLVAVLAATVLTGLYNSRTALVALCLGSGGMLLAIGGWRRAGLLLLAGIIVLTAALNSKLMNPGKYGSLLSAETYASNRGLSLRPALWGGSVDVIRERPVMGYGYGWKKMSSVIEAGDFIERWKTTRPDAADFFTKDGKPKGYGGANPHSLVLQILFELGAVGVAIYAAMWIAWLRGTLPAAFVAWRSARDAEARNLLILCWGVVVPYVLLNLMNGYWEGSVANIMLCWMCLAWMMARAEKIG